MQLSQKELNDMISLLKTIGFVEERVVEGKTIYPMTAEGHLYYSRKIFLSPIEVGKA
jgi:hypothetical protein